MTRPVLLNNIDHRGLRVSAAYGPWPGQATTVVPTFAAEFRALQAHYPVVFQKDARGTLHPVALLGLEAGQNLFLARRGVPGDGADAYDWDARYVPLAVQRQPFLIGHDGNGEPMLHIDLDHPRVGQGEALFLEHGGSAPFLQRMTSIVRALHDGLSTNAAFVEALLAHGLLEPFVLDLRLSGRAPARLGGLYTIAEERLAALDAQALLELSRAGYLEAAYMAIASLSRLQDLVDRLEHGHACDA